VINPIHHGQPECEFLRPHAAPGNISFIPRAERWCTAVLDFAADRENRFSKFISIGNKADVEELDLLQVLFMMTLIRRYHALY